MLKKKTAIILAMVSIALIITVLLFQANEKKVYAVNIDGKTIGYVEQTTDIDNLVSTIKADVQKIYGADAKITLDINYSQSKTSSLPTDDISKLEDAIRKSLKVEVGAVQIVIGGTAVATLKDEEQCTAVLTGVKKHYLDKESDSELKSATFDKEITFKKAFVAPEEVTEIDTAVTKILNGTDEIRVHSVKKGESLWSIASSNRMSVSDVKQANPQLKTETIQIGQKLNLVVPEPFVNVTTTEEVTYQQSIPFSTIYKKDDSLLTFQQKVIERGIYGTKQVTAKVTKVNGLETKREILKETVLKEPTPQVVARGTKDVPSRGTGRFLWPISGRITSPFGRRGREMHTGVDIAGPAGDDVKAADSGTVRFSGRSGGYGNLIIIDHGNGFSTYYAHNQKNLVSAGDEIDKGGVIAKRGSTGRSTGNHLHFEIRKDGNPQDPLNYFK
jgi:murein DD-endopeptidase MepM/ murein hydrolase activator NlpD